MTLKFDVFLKFVSLERVNATKSYIVERINVVSRNEISRGEGGGNLCKNRMWLMARDRGISLNSQLLDESSRASTQLQPFEPGSNVMLPFSFCRSRLYLPFLFGNWPDTLLCGLRERDRVLLTSF